MVIVESEYEAVATGQLQKRWERDDVTVYEYEINRLMSVNDVGLVVGRFRTVEQDGLRVHYPGQFARVGDLKTYLQSKEFERMLMQLERYWFKDLTLDRIREQMGVGSLQHFLEDCHLIVVPAIYNKLFTSFTFSPFLKIVLLDEAFIPAYPQPCYHTLTFGIRQLLVHLNAVVVKHFLMESSLQDYWILHAMPFLIVEEDKELRKKVMDSIRTGSDVILSHAEMSVFETQSIHFERKAVLVMWQLARLTHSSEKYPKYILIKLFQDWKQPYPPTLPTDFFFKLTKKVFGIKEIKYFNQNFVQSSGCASIRIVDHYSKQDHKLTFEIGQAPLQSEWVYSYSQNRAVADEKGEASRQFMEIHKCIKEIDQLTRQRHKQYEESFLEQLRSQEMGEKKNQLNQELHQWKQKEDLKKNEREHFKQTYGMVPQQLRSSMWFYGKMRITICETNELELKSDEQEIKVEGKGVNKIEVNWTQTLKKINISKRHQEINEQNYLNGEQNTQLPGNSEEVNNENIAQTKLIHGILEEALMKSGT